MKIIRMKEDVQTLKKGELYKTDKDYKQNGILEVENILIVPSQYEEVYYNPVKYENTITYYNEFVEHNGVHFYERKLNTQTRVRIGNKTVSYQETKKDDDYKIIYNGDYTICIIDNKYKGIAKRNPKDVHSRQIGHDLALYRARIKEYEDKITKFYNYEEEI